MVAAGCMIAGTGNLLLRWLLATSNALIDSPGPAIEIGGLEVEMIATIGSSSSIACLCIGGPIFICWADSVPGLRLLLHKISRIDLGETAA